MGSRLLLALYPTCEKSQRRRVGSKPISTTSNITFARLEKFEPLHSARQVPHSNVGIEARR
jgi:hypothetical protein